MIAEIAWYPHQASTTAVEVDRLFLGLIAVCGTVGVLVAVLIIGFSVRYRRRPGTPTPLPLRGNTALEIFWSVAPLGIFVLLFAWGAVLYFDAYRAPDDAEVIYVVAKQWMWKFQHPEGQREIKELHVPAGRPIKLIMTSEDVIHSFFVPDFRVHMDVLPGRYTTVWFKATRPGEYHLFCSQYCGTNHSGMIATVIVMRPDEYEQWLNRKPDGSRTREGEKVFLKYRCASCHTGDAGGRAPTLEDIYGRPIPLRDGRTVIADEEYIRESILDPGAKIVAGYENIMPTFRGQIDEDEIVQVIAWLRWLVKGQTPRRVEEFPPPTTTPPINPLEEKKP